LPKVPGPNCLLYQEPEHLPRALQVEPLTTGVRLWWIIRHLPADTTSDYHLVTTPSRTKQPRSFHWEALGMQQLRLHRNDQTLAVYDGRPQRPFPGLASILLPQSTVPAVEELRVSGAGTAPPHRQTRLDSVSPPVDGPVFARLSSRGHWLDERHDRLLEEMCLYTFYRGDRKTQLLDLTISLRATFGPVCWGGGDMSGLLELVFPEVCLRSTDHSLTNSLGAAGAVEVERRRAAWCRVDATGTTVLFDSPLNPGSPCCWHWDSAARSLTADPFSQSPSAANAHEREYLTLNTGETLTHRYRLIVSSERLSSTRVQAHLVNYVFPPHVAVLPN
jgi:hypothetical protein